MMQETTACPPTAIVTGSPSLLSRLRDVFVVPMELFDCVADSKFAFANWCVPFLFSWLAGILAFGGLSAQPEFRERFTSDQSVLKELHIDQLQASDSLANREAISALTQLKASLEIGLAAVFGTGWSALMIWSIGRWILKSRFGFLKAVEVVGLTQMILALGTVTTVLLNFAANDPFVRPALSVLLDETHRAGKLYLALDAINVFHLWAVAVVACGLSKLAKVSFAEAGFWVFGYWLGIRIGLVVLGGN